MTTVVTSAPTVAGQKDPSRLPSLTGMRFIAAALVFLFHSSRVDPLLSPFHGAAAHWDAILFGQAGWVGVSFFFVLSGFVLTWVVKPSEAPARFWRRRAVKLYPNHVVTFAATMLILTSAAPWRQWLPNLLLVQTWFPSPHLDTIFSIDQPSWSLSCEIVFYLFFPLLYRRVAAIPARRLWLWAGVTVAAVFAVACIAQFALPRTFMVPIPGGPVFHASEWQVWMVYALPPARMLEFVLGMIMARIVMSGRWIRLSLPVAGVIALASYVVGSFVPWSFAAVAVCALPLALLIASAAAVDTQGGRSLLRRPVMVWLGEVSFAFYLVHGPVLGFLRGIVTPGQTYAASTAAGLVIGAFIVALSLAWVLHTVVEQPMMRRWGRSRRSDRLESFADEAVARLPRV